MHVGALYKYSKTGRKEYEIYQHHLTSLQCHISKECVMETTQIFIYPLTAQNSLDVPSVLIGM